MANLFDGKDDAALWRALHDPEFRALLTDKGRAMFPLPVNPVNADFRKRLDIERDELFERMKKLDTFMSDNPLFKTLSEKQQKLMQDQFSGMSVYFAALSERIADLDVPASVVAADETFEALDDVEVREVRTIGSDDEPLPFE